ncbi:hypothetical protein LCM19_09270 [Qipengyuania flava]|nr:hypothetical protein [Qipengyuania flava]
MTAVFIFRAILALAGAGLVSGCGPDDQGGGIVAQSVPADKKRMEAPKDRMPPVSLIRPDWPSLGGQNLVDAMSGRALVLDEEFEIASGVKPQVIYSGGCPPDERFDADGKWTGIFCFRVKTTFEGQWTVEKFRGGERLCVEAEGYSERCRSVWQGEEPDQLFLPAETISDQEDDPVRYNPYRIKTVAEAE